MKHITDTALARVFNTCCATIEQMVNEEHEGVEPALVGFDSTGALLGLLVPHGATNAMQASDDGKDVLAEFIRYLLRETPKQLDPLACVVHITEAHVARYENEDTDLARTLLRAGVPVREQRARRDAVMLALHTSSGTSLNVLDIEGEGDTRRVMRPDAMLARGSGEIAGRFAVAERNDNRSA